MKNWIKKHPRAAFWTGAVLFCLMFLMYWMRQNSIAAAILFCRIQYIRNIRQNKTAPVQNAARGCFLIQFFMILPSHSSLIPKRFRWFFAPSLFRKNKTRF